MDIKKAIDDFEVALIDAEGPIKFTFNYESMVFILETTASSFKFIADSNDSMIEFLQGMQSKLTYLDDVINAALSEIIIN